MSEYDKNKIDKEIVDQLKSLEVPYEEGAWEKFASAQGMADQTETRIIPISEEVLASKNSSKIRPIGGIGWNKLAGLAASILFLAGTFWFFNRETLDFDFLQPDLLSESNPALPTTLQKSEEIDEGTVTEVASPQISLTSLTENSSTNSIVSTTHNTESVLGESDRLEDLNFRAEMLTAEVTGSPVRAELASISQSSDFRPGFDSQAEAIKFAIEKSEPGEISSHTHDNWNFGMHLNSNLTTDKVNVGGGLFVSYQLNPYFSIKSGISVGSYGLNRAKSDFLGHVSARLKGEDVNIFEIEKQNSIANDVMHSSPSVGPQGPNKPGEQLAANKIPAFYKRNLVGSTSQVLTWDIPLDLNINFDKNFYGSVGVSFVGVLNEKRFHHYEEIYSETPKQFNNQDLGSLHYDIQYTNVVSEAEIKPLKGNTYTGFMNISLGRKVKLNNSFGLGLEPFVKIPIGNLKKEEMNFTNMGLKLVTHF